MFISYKYRIYPNKKQIETLNKHFNLCLWLYNSALEERIVAYRSIGKNVSYKEQQNELPDIKLQFPEFKQVHSQVLQDVLRRLDNSFHHFFRRLKVGEKAGYPRFKNENSFSSFTYTQTGFRFIDNKINFSKIGSIKIRLHRKIEGIIKTCSIKKSSNQWYVVFNASIGKTVAKKPISNAVGIDLGLEHFAVFSNGDKIENPRYLKKSEEKLKCLQSKYSKYKGVATKRKFSRLHIKISNQRNDFLHKQSKSLINKYGLIVYEDLTILKMMRNNFGKSICDAAWGKFIKYVSYKAENAGKYCIAVNPKYTSQICSNCGILVKKDISTRMHDCPNCGLSLHRDLNASINILRLGISLIEDTIVNGTPYEAKKICSSL